MSQYQKSKAFENGSTNLNNSKVHQIWYCHKCIKFRLCIKCLSKFRSGRFITDPQYRKEAIKEEIRKCKLLEYLIPF